ncbi:hypothetical protein KGF54_002247 [Candida jiufengensis]|uniref:uncharacterized protein n=1 Tax=Candida jiufengensis TaxID=497108 RepID=UPI002224C270|nr:uncharacterized protein KGF54_002247 [Candida jiufengensis]KAI5954472.1 hypothetical protein KGF54_002247 [Candida jiufengensis]
MPVHKEISIFSTITNISILFLKLFIVYIKSWFNRKPNCPKSIDCNPYESEECVKDKIIKAKDINEIVSIFGYKAREHVVTTRDGYLLCIHKLEKFNTQDKEEQLNLENTNKKNSNKIVYLHHGLLTNSELWCLGSKKEKTLPYLLVDLGYEVWLGNNRGNKYSRKHLKLSASSVEFWDFSLDEFSYFDIPDIICYIDKFYERQKNLGNLDVSSMNSSRSTSGSTTPVIGGSTTTLNEPPPIKSSKNQIIYIGFSQGCSQLFASLSLFPEFNDKISLFIGLSPAIIPQNLNHPIFKIIVDQTAHDNSFLYSLFGRRAIFPSVSFWSTFFGPILYEKIVDKSLMLLFGWSNQNINNEQKKVGYPHMFSNSSVKSLLHWFQIIRAKRFQMFDETCSTGLTKLSSLSDSAKVKGNRVTPFPINDHLKIPMVLFCGDSDILVDMEKTKSLILDSNKAMTNKLEIIMCESYEHMDTLWGNDVYELVFSKILKKLENLNGDEGNNNKLGDELKLD